METVPEVRIVVVGDPDCGKSTFLAHLPHARHGSPSVLRTIDPVRDFDIPLTFNVTLFARPYTFHITSTSSPTQLSLPNFPTPDMLILTYDISSRNSLSGLVHTWYHHLQMNYAHLEDRLPVMLLGLKRDLRPTLPENEMILPQEGHRMAQKLHCDAYAECSALTGELMWEVLEDVTKMAAKTTTEKGAKSEGGGCIAM